MGAAAGAAALGLGIGLGLPRMGSTWWRDGALLDADFAGGRFVHLGRTYPGKAAFLAAISGAEADGTISIGPYVAPDAPELLSNGDFSAGTGGWAAAQSGGTPCSLSDGGGFGRITASATDSPAALHPVTVAVGRAYQVRSKVRRVSLNARPWYTSNANGAGGFGAAGPTVSSTSFVETVNTLSTLGAVTTLYIGARAIANPANGVFELDDFSVKECTPFPGFVPAAVSGVIEATTPATPVGSKVLWQTDDGMMDHGLGTPNERNYIRLYWAADRHLRLLVAYQTAAGTVTTQADLDLGLIEPSTPFKVAFSAAPNSFVAALDGQPAVSNTSGTFPGAAIMRIGRSQTTANNWDGAIGRLTLWSTAKPTEELEDLSAAGPGHGIVAWGDSLTAGGGASGAATRYPAVASAAFNPDCPVSNQGIGGQTSTAIAARQGGVPVLLTVAGNQLPASGPVAVTAKEVGGVSANDAGPITEQGPQVLMGWLAGAYGALARDASWNYNFTRAVAGAVVDCPPGSTFVPQLAVSLRARTQWLWLGRNEASAGRTVVQDIAAAVAYLGHNRYLVGAIILGSADGGSGQAAKEATNAVLAAPMAAASST